MKDLLVVILTTLTVSVIWITMNTKEVAEQNFVPENLLEMSLPISGTIDVEFLSGLK